VWAYTVSDEVARPDGSYWSLGAHRGGWMLWGEPGAGVFAASTGGTIAQKRP
jgi:hypothetical protein